MGKTGNTFKQCCSFLDGRISACNMTKSLIEIRLFKTETLFEVA